MCRRRARQTPAASDDSLCVHTEANMAVLGSSTVPFLVVSVSIAALTYITYKLLSGYLRNWYEMKPIPQPEETYPFIGNALLFKNNSGGKAMTQHVALICVQIANPVPPVRSQCLHLRCRFLSANSGSCT